MPSTDSPTSKRTAGHVLAPANGYLPSLSKAEASGGDGAERRHGCDNNTQTLFDASPDWQKEWQGMPEFVQERQREYANDSPTSERMDGQRSAAVSGYAPNESTAAASGDGEASQRSRGRDEWPRIVTNGRKYRIELSPLKYPRFLMQLSGSGLQEWEWETRFLWRAKRELQRLCKKEKWCPT